MVLLSWKFYAAWVWFLTLVPIIVNTGQLHLIVRWMQEYGILIFVFMYPCVSNTSFGTK